MKITFLKDMDSQTHVANIKYFIGELKKQLDFERMSTSELDEIAQTFQDIADHSLIMVKKCQIVLDNKGMCEHCFRQPASDIMYTTRDSYNHETINTCEDCSNNYFSVLQEEA